MSLSQMYKFHNIFVVCLFKVLTQTPIYQEWLLLTSHCSVDLRLNLKTLTGFAMFLIFLILLTPIVGVISPTEKPLQMSPLQ